MKRELPPEILDWLEPRSKPIALALDYDGTLVPICQTPEQAHPDSELLNLLRDLAQQVVVVILTGRDRSVMAQWIPDRSITIVTSHGAEWRRDGRWRPLFISPKDQRPMRVLTERLEKAFGKTPGVIIEDKKATVAFHYRLVDPHNQNDLLNRFTDLVRPWLGENQEFEVLEGKCVREVRPEGLNKGRALRHVLDEIGIGDLPVLAMGDDRTDEDMFQGLKNGDLSVFVGPTRTSAAVQLRDVWEARKLLKAVLRLEWM